jgi:hypothetical protein
MAKTVHNDVLDAALDKIATCTLLTVCSAEPTTLAEAVTTYKLADIALTAGDGNGDYVIADDTSGRKLTVAEQADVAVDTSGDATHVALTDGTSLLYVTTCTTQTLTGGNTVTVPTFKINIQDPT